MQDSFCFETSKTSINVPLVLITDLYCNKGKNLPQALITPLSLLPGTPGDFLSVLVCFAVAQLVAVLIAEQLTVCPSRNIQRPRHY